MTGTAATAATAATAGTVQRPAGYVTFRLGDRVFAAQLAVVREIVRLQGLAELPAMPPPLAGVLDLRGTPLPVLDIRPDGAGRGRTGDVLVLEATAAGNPVGVAVDEVCAVLDADELRAPAAGAAPVDRLLPGYVLDVLHDGERQVFLVDLRLMFTGQPAAAGAGRA